MNARSNIALVTGGSGFIGSEVIRSLTNQGFQVRVLMRKTSPRHNLAGTQFEEIQGDLTNADSLARAVDGVNYVFHIAGVVTAKTKEEYFKHNVQGTKNLADASKTANLKRFVYVSS